LISFSGLPRPVPVEALDDLRTRRAEAERKPPVGHVVETGRRHRGQRWRPGVELEDPGRDLQPLGAGGDIAELADRVETVGLRDEHDVEPGLLVVAQLRDRFGETAAVVDRHSHAHRELL